MIRFLNYLPASMGLKLLPSRIARLGIASDWHPFEQYSMPMTGDHWVGCGCLGNVIMEFICAEGLDELSERILCVNRINEVFRKFFHSVRMTSLGLC